MEEAEALCDRVLVIDRGRIVALDTPGSLIRSLGRESRVIFSVEEGFDPQFLKTLAGVTKVEREGAKVTVTGEGERLVVLVVNALDARAAPFSDLRAEKPDLEDVFLAVTK